jgi:oligopeptide transport system ATP-binding protein
MALSFENRKEGKMSENNNFLQDKDINLDPNQDLSLLDREVKEVPHDVKEDDYILEVKNLKMYFPINISVFKTVPLKAVDEVSFKIRRGETFGLVGESGCGKTTLGRTILQLYQPTAGEVYFNGKQVKGKAALKEFRRKATIVFQDPYSSLDP